MVVGFKETWQVHMWQASCILVGSAPSNSSWVVISAWRWLILSSVMKCERWINQDDTSVGQRNIWVPNRNRTHDLLSGRSIHWATRTHGEQDHFTDFICDRHPASVLVGSALSNSLRVVISEWRWLILSSMMKCERWIFCPMLGKGISKENVSCR